MVSIYYDSGPWFYHTTLFWWLYVLSFIVPPVLIAYLGQRRDNKLYQEYLKQQELENSQLEQNEQVEQNEQEIGFKAFVEERLKKYGADAFEKGEDIEQIFRYPENHNKISKNQTLQNVKEKNANDSNNYSNANTNNWGIEYIAQRYLNQQTKNQDKRINL